MRCRYVCGAVVALIVARDFVAIFYPGPLLTPEERVDLREAFDKDYAGSRQAGGAAGATSVPLGELSGKAADVAAGERRAMLKYFAGEVARDGGGSICNDLSNVLFAVKASFERGARAGILVDVGANTGQTTVDLVRVFEQRMLSVAPRHSSVILGDKFHKAVRRNGGDICFDANGPLRVYTFEANPASYKLLKRTLWWELGSSEHNITTKCALVSDREGRAEIFHRGAADLEASANPSTATEGGKPLEKSSEVDAVSLDGLFAAGGKQIHLLKVDTEGFDPVVLRGASQLLSQRLVKFLVFEYSSKWRLAGHKLTLKGVVGKLEQQGYSCFFIKPHVLVPLTGKWWQEVYELKHQIFVVNVFCGQTADHDLFDAYVGFGTSSYTLLYALANLQISGSSDQAEA